MEWISFGAIDCTTRLFSFYLRVTTTIIYYMLEIESCFKRVCMYQERQTTISQLYNYNFHPIKQVISSVSMKELKRRIYY